MNNIVEKVSYNEGRYWGEPNKFRFRTQIDSFEDQLEISTDSDRLVKTEFTLTINGYLKLLITINNYYLLLTINNC